MTAPSVVTTDLVVSGMTCAACVGRVEKKLARIPDVTASVNLATGRARVTHPAELPAERLISAVEQAGYTAELPPPPARAGTETVTDATDGAARAADRDRLLGTAALALPVMLLSMVPAWQFNHWQWLCFTLAAPVATWGAWPFHRQALRGLRHSAATMDTLVSVGVSASFLWSVYALFVGGAGEQNMRMPFSWLPSAGDGVAHVYLEAAVGVPLFVLTGRYLEARARRGTGSALRALAELGAKDVELRGRNGEGGRRMPIAELRVGQEFLVRPGEKVATDGVVVEGSSALDLSLVTGESTPVEVGPGATVVGAAVNSGGLLVVRATAVGADTQLERITRLVTDAQAGKARIQRLADSVAGVFVPAVVTVACTVLGFWLGAGAGAEAAVTAAVAVLVVACPCALGLATPTAFLAATGRGAQLGILIREPGALERLRRVDTVVFDKTGTLTSGRMTLVATETVPDGPTASEVLRLAGAVEHGSEHPIGRAVAAAARRRAEEGAAPPGAEDFRALPGVGVTGRVEGHEVRVIAPRDRSGLPEVLRRALDRAEHAAHTAVVVEMDGRAVAVLAVGDTVRPSGYRAVRHLRELGIESVLLTGDGPAAAAAVAEQVGITRVHAGVAPQGKAEIIAELRASGRRVAMVGDGVNDAAALAVADLGIAMGTGTDAAIGAADITLVREDMEAVVQAVRLTRRTLRTIRVNLGWAFAYNVLTLPLAATGWLDPMFAALAMSASSVLVVGNSLRLCAPSHDTGPGSGSGPRRSGRRPGRPDGERSLAGAR
ncbi:heavy metal translocating P-type ATPase [Streptomyces sp. H39-S7]|uniref:heavy metal translocating P-type ATPase n=1 Tax=Streptomyces sp. H39-S7 TaxID=3004357 RepID=UPI0022AE8EDB|nr:heavy metal translocating P-type ATPase [Streptomyces sp. H39-S7]MCZ4119457.1 heavy metal translocating P-type ATPase [Streptomyces sp. H39-S7]